MLIEWIEALALGMVQGVTEFLPVSSDGHLLITQQFFAWLTGTHRGGEENLFFDVMLHLGTMAAILYHYRGPIRLGVRGLLTDDPDVGPDFRRPTVLRVAMLAIVATLPLVPFALFFKKWVDSLFQSHTAAPVGFLISAVFLALVSLKMRGPDGRGRGPSETTWVDALLIGLAQTLAPLPGVSRSGVTIVAALFLGLSRVWAVRFSLMIAIPAIAGAVANELKDAIKDPSRLNLTPDRVMQTIAAMILAGLVGYAAILWLIRVVRSGKLWYCSVYLVLLAVVVLGLVSSSGNGSDVDASPNALDGTSRRVDAGASPATGPVAPGGPVDRADAPLP
ncbi:undecaprenyl-diphosphate phosphatase [Planctomyces sp. SH-PL62]|uniref:undecaprenyl-diphosphate phosphatase n=1 Tax=Planctomyces sp. SH-PL62 TaxID=1636152 RepID=UPI00078D0AD7|nr:undecaprenyl-diphosphate phosphatase [Planctomyces sp. SH-PL62]AMV38317.1 Undecaprenyl-diphosphatase [Planctomyces sp. SH-PL62]